MKSLKGLNPLKENPCDSCLSGHKNGRFHYIDKDGYSFMYVCPKRYTCSKIDKYHSKRIECITKASRLPNYLLTRSIENFTISEWWQHNLMTTLSMWTYTDNKWVCLTGGPGTGKTHVCAALSVDLLNQGIEVFYTYYAELIEWVRYHNEPYIEKAKNVSVLFLDDLYKGNTGFQEVKAIANIINYRYTHNLVTLITTEKTPDELFEIDQATTGRIIDRCNGCWVDLPHDKESDYRIRDFLGMYDK